jgi:hypothetical protein
MCVVIIEYQYYWFSYLGKYSVFICGIEYYKLLFNYSEQ